MNSVYAVHTNLPVLPCFFLLVLSANLFASGSHDGMILLWSTNTLSAMKMFQSVDPVPQQVTKEVSGPSLVHTADTNIRQILAIGEVCCYIADFVPRILPSTLTSPSKFQGVVQGKWFLACGHVRALHCFHSSLYILHSTIEQ